MEINVNELTGTVLDWAVAKAVGAYATANGGSEIWGCKIWSVPGFENMRWDDWTPSTDWAQGGPLIDLYGLGVVKFYPPVDGPVLPGCEWAALWIDDSDRRDGPTALIAACRCIVAANIGSVVNVPDELL